MSEIREGSIVERRNAIVSQYVKLNIGGCLFYTTVDTLTKKDTMLRAMFSGRMNVLADNEGWVLIDRPGKHFDKILSYLRDNTIVLPKNKQELSEILIEAKFYAFQELIEYINEEINIIDNDIEPICKIPLITSKKEENFLINNTKKPVVKLLLNRHNNKYSYTNNSDDNLLKNIELFDRLSLRFSHRILFIKDILGSNEICCWSFYGNKQKVAEVCCTSIVYATEKKQTKVDFPEARIYEETLNILLFESQPNLDVSDIESRHIYDKNNNSTSDDEDTKDLEKFRRLRCS